MESDAEEIVASKPRIVFGVDRANEDGLGGLVEFYVFDKEFIPIEDVGESRYERYSVFKIKDEAAIAQPFSKLDHRHLGASYASFGSHVFRVGGDVEVCRKCTAALNSREMVELYDVPRGGLSPYVDLWDATTNCWELRFARMNVGRTAPHLHILGGKLFAIGGRDYDDKPIFMEVLDQSTRCWTPLPNPSPEVAGYYFVSATLDDSILLGSLKSKSFYSYKPQSNYWEHLVHLPFNDRLLQKCIRLPAVVVDTHLLWLDYQSGTNLIGFDLKSCKYFTINLGDEGLLPSRKCHHYYPRLLRSGNAELVLIWREKSLYKLEGQTKGTAGEEEGEDEDLFDRRDAFSAIHCTHFVIDFVKAQQIGSPCLRMIWHQKCIGPDLGIHRISAGFVLDVDVSTAVAGLSDRNVTREEAP